MSAEIKKKIQLEIAHVLFTDIVGYSKPSVDEQHARMMAFWDPVRGDPRFEKIVTSLAPKESAAAAK
jgi:hypothetical protein